MLALMSAFGARLRQLREGAGLTQRALASRLNIGPSTIAHYEIGNREPDYETLRRLANFFGVTISYFLGDEPAGGAGAEPRFPFGIIVSLESRKDRLLHRLSEPGLTIPERQAVLSELDDVERQLKILTQGTLSDPTRPPLKTVPRLGTIHAGLPHWTEQDIIGWDYTTDSDADFSLLVKGDCLIGAGIIEGDRVIFRATQEAKHGDLVASLVNGDEVTLKFLVHEDGRWFLRAANPKYPDRPIDPESGRIQGVALEIVRKAPRLERPGTARK